jgi:hypothetical protein
MRDLAAQCGQLCALTSPPSSCDCDLDPRWKRFAAAVARQKVAHVHSARVAASKSGIVHGAQLAKRALHAETSMDIYTHRHVESLLDRLVATWKAGDEQWKAGAR